MVPIEKPHVQLAGGHVPRPALSSPAVDVVGRVLTEPLVWPVAVVPSLPGSQLRLQGASRAMKE